MGGSAGGLGGAAGQGRSGAANVAGAGSAVASAGAAGAAASGGSPATAPLEVYADGEWVDIRVRLEPGTRAVAVHLDRSRAVEPFRELRYVLFSPSEGDPELSLAIGAVHRIALQACHQAALSADGQSLRILLPQVYAFDGEPFRAALERDGQALTDAQFVEALPAFEGELVRCDPSFTVVSDHPYQQLLGVIGLNSYTRVCALDTGGEAACWSTRESISAAPAGPFEELGLVALLSVCGRRSNGQVECWPLDADPGLALPRIPAGAYRELADYGSCGILESGAVRCWDTTAPDAVAFELPGDHRHVDGATGGGCAVEATGRLACWGFATGDDAVPVELLEGEYDRVAVGSGVVCAMTPAGVVECALRYEDELVQLGGGPFVSLGGPWAICATNDRVLATCVGRAAPVPYLPFLQLAAGEWSQPPCGILLDGQLACWGDGAGALLLQRP